MNRKYDQTVSGVRDYMKGGGTPGQIPKVRNLYRQPLVPTTAPPPLQKPDGMQYDDGFTDAISGSSGAYHMQYGERGSKLATCNACMTFVMMTAMIFAAILLMQDSNEFDTMKTRVVSYMDAFDDTRTLATMKQFTDDYHSTLRPNVLVLMERVDSIGKIAHSTAVGFDGEHVVDHLHTQMLELQSWMDHINHTLTSSALHFNIKL
jgi:hypothetical protein